MYIDKLISTQDYIWKDWPGQKVSANMTNREHTKTGVKGNEAVNSDLVSPKPF